MSCIFRSVVIALTLVVPAAAQVTGTGTANHLPLWTGATNLGNSVVIQSGGNIGVGNSSPSAILDVTGKTGSAARTAEMPPQPCGLLEVREPEVEWAVQSSSRLVTVGQYRLRL